MSANQPSDVGSPASVVVIEDDADVRFLLERHLRHLGWTVRGVETGEEGLAAVADSCPDAVVVDLGLPGISGADVVRHLREDRATLSCRVVVTSVLDRSEQQRLRPDAVLPKPFTRRDVSRAMAAVMGPVPA